MQRKLLIPLFMLLVSVSWTNKDREPGRAGHPQQDVIMLKFENNCHERASLLLYYMKGGQWIMDGWWEIDPGKTLYVADTDNRIFCFYARSATYRWEGNLRYTFRGAVYGFKQVDIEAGVGTYIHTLNCN